MSEKIKMKSIIVIIIAMILGIYVIFFQDQIIKGIIIIGGGISLNFFEVVKWIKGLINFVKSFNNGEEKEPKSEKSSDSNLTNIVNIGDNANFQGDTAVGGSKIDKK